MLWGEVSFLNWIPLNGSWKLWLCKYYSVENQVVWLDLTENENNLNSKPMALRGKTPIFRSNGFWFQLHIPSVTQNHTVFFYLIWHMTFLDSFILSFSKSLIDFLSYSWYWKDNKNKPFRGKCWVQCSRYFVCMISSTIQYNMKKALLFNSFFLLYVSECVWECMCMCVCTPMGPCVPQNTCGIQRQLVGICVLLSLCSSGSEDGS